MATDRGRRAMITCLCLPVLSLALLVAPALTAEAAGAGNVQALAQQGLHSLDMASGGRGTLRLSRETGVAAFFSVPRDAEIAVSGKSPAARAAAFLDAHGAAFGVRDSRDLHATSTLEDALGMQHVRLEQVHQGLPIAPAEVVVHMSAKGVRSVAAKALPGPIDVSTQPTITPERAVETARAFGARLARGAEVKCSPARLEILAQRLLDRPQAPERLAWAVGVSGAGVAEGVWVDAQTGQVLFHASGIYYALAREVMDSETGVVVRAEGQPPTGNAGYDAAYDHAGDVFAYYSAQFGMTTWPLNSGVMGMTVGSEDGDYAWSNGINLTPAAAQADDIVGHEFSHALIQDAIAGRQINVIPPAHIIAERQTRQSLFLEEAFADAMGEAIDLANGTGNDADDQRWLIGEDWVGVGPVRNMLHPEQFNRPGRVGDTAYPIDCVTSPAAANGSSVPAHALALIAEGGSYNGRTIAGIGAVKMSQIVYRTGTLYFGRGANFMDAYYGIRQACDDLVGTAGITAEDCGEVQKALDVVELDAPVCGLAQAELCPSGQTVTNVFFDNFETANAGWTETEYPAGFTMWQWGGYDWRHGSMARTGRRHAQALDPPMNDIADTQAVLTPQQAVAVPADARLGFSTYMHVKAGYDGGVVEYSVDGGATWVDVLPLHVAGLNYSTTPVRTDVGSALGGRRAFAGDSVEYESSVYNLSSASGQDVLLRFRWAVDATGEAPGTFSTWGWLVDDVRIYTCTGGPAGGVVSMASATASVDEGAGNLTLTVTRSGGTAGGVAVAYRTNDASGTATAGSDYTATSGTITFLANETSKTISVPIVDDSAVDPAETLIVELTDVAGSGATLGVPASTTVTIVDNDGPGPGVTIEEVIWTAESGVTVSGNDLTKTAASGWGNAGAVSTRAITAGDGYVEFTANETNAGRMVGLSRGDTNTDFTDVDFGAFLSANGALMVYEGGVSRGTFGSYAAGDVIRVAVTSGVVRYSRNGTRAYTSTLTPAYPLLVDAALRHTGATIRDAVISGTLTGSPIGPAPTPTPTPVVTTEEVLWTATSGVTASGNDLTKTAASGWGNAGAISTRSIQSGDGYVEFVVSETNTGRAIGLSSGNASTDYTDIDFAVFVSANRALMVYEAGVSRGTFAAYATGDVVRIAVSAGVVSYLRNGTVFYTSRQAPKYPLLVDAALKHSGATLKDVVIAGTLIGSPAGPAPTPPPATTTEDVVWTAAGGVTVSGNDLTKTAASGWGNAGAISTRAIRSGDGYVEFVINETNTGRMVGLSAGNTNMDFGDVDFGAFASANGELMVYEGGVSRGSFGAYATGDVIRVAVAAGRVRYSRNGSVVYTSTRTPAYPLLVDAALKHTGATVRDAVISGSLVSSTP